ncbi:Teichoic acids export ATP-binding protein TagH [Anaerolineae bacterium]|nr:Teichoic acids export ATP-binding protein TagH [Anaerolineae bacterium]
MGDIAVRVENLSKLYRIGAKQESYKTFRDSITDAVTAPFKRVAGLLRGNAAAAANLDETIWALKDVSFEVKRGEVVGIIGRNGAGKSTLLKILSRITEPTSGEAKVYGRVGALLEVGTGFHPELTGRENIYLNGAILGMSRETIKRKFDEIVAFAEVEKFIDTPVKHYSSGMGLRLGFAVAAHLEPEILIVDEVLAVGDAAFQKKCLGKMGEVAGEGRTVLFVSHNMVAVQSLCQRAVVLSNGEVVQTGTTDDMIRFYLATADSPPKDIALKERLDRTGSGLARITNLELLDRDLRCVDIVRSGDNVLFRVGYVLAPETKNLHGVFVFVRLDDQFGRSIFTVTNQFTGEDFGLVPLQGAFLCSVPRLPLVAGRYRARVSIFQDSTRLDTVENAVEFDVANSDVYGTRRVPSNRKHGVIWVDHSWTFEHSEPNRSMHLGVHNEG